MIYRERNYQAPGLHVSVNALTTTRSTLASQPFQLFLTFSMKFALAFCNCDLEL